MNYSKKVIPVSYGILTADGNQFLGIGDLNQREQTGKFVLYDLATDRVIMTLREALIVANWGETLANEERGISDKGGLFVGRFAKRIRKGYSHYTIEEYDPRTGRLFASIPVAEVFKEKPEDYYRVNDVVRINRDEVLIAAIDDSEYAGAAIVVALYNTRTHQHRIVDRIAAYTEEGFGFSDLRFDEYGHQLKARVIGSDALESPTAPVAWENVDFEISRYLDSIDEADPDSRTDTIDFAEWAEETLIHAVQEPERRHKGHVRFTDYLSGENLVLEEITRQDYMDYMYVGDLKLVVVVVSDPEGCNVFILEYCDTRWFRAETLRFGPSFTMRYDIEHQTAILQDDSHTVLLTALENA